MEKILNLFYPPVCGICGQINDDFICDKCLDIVYQSKINLLEVDKYEKLFYQKKFFFLKYEGIIRKSIIDYKFNDSGYLYKTFQKIILNDKKVCDFIKCYDIIIPIPIHKNRKKERGYNQSYLIIKGIVNELNSKYKTDIITNNSVLRKNIDTPRQSMLNKEEREKNLKNAYCLTKKEDLVDKKILIFDDIYTTGNTVKECTKILLKANPKCVDVLTFTKD